MCIERYISRELLNGLVESEFWRNLLDDPELWPEVRVDRVTVYYRGRALIRELRMKAGAIVAQTHPKFIPVSAEGAAIGLSLDGEGRLVFSENVDVVAPGLADAETLLAYKTRLRALSGRENDIIHAILLAAVTRNDAAVRNLVLDQEIVIHDEETNRPPRIDLAYVDRNLGKLAFAEVKRRGDSRLFPIGGDPPKVLEQLQTYSACLATCHDEVLAAFEALVDIKHQLGLGPRLQDVNSYRPFKLLKKPILVIGDMSADDVGSFQLDWRQEGIDHGWRVLTDGLRAVTHGVILTGRNGCLLDWEQSPQKLLSVQ